MTEPDESTDPREFLDEVMVPEEQATPDHHAHGKTPKHLNEEDLERRTEHERVEVGLDDFDPDDVPPATE
jgi:hypothetical protein